MHECLYWVTVFVLLLLLLLLVVVVVLQKRKTVHQCSPVVCFSHGHGLHESWFWSVRGFSASFCCNQLSDFLFFFHFYHVCASKCHTGEETGCVIKRVQAHKRFISLMSFKLANKKPVFVQRWRQSRARREPWIWTETQTHVAWWTCDKQGSAAPAHSAKLQVQQAAHSGEKGLFIEDLIRKKKKKSIQT